MSYQDELREQARKRARRDYRNKMLLLVVFLIAVLFVMHLLGKNTGKLANSNNQVKSQTQQVESSSETNDQK